MFRHLILSSLVLLALTACGKEKSVADIASDLDSYGTRELIEDAAEDEYQPPADQRLTDDQVAMYLKVREHEKEIARVAREQMKEHTQKASESGEKSVAGLVAGFKGLGSVADLMTADIRAAKDLGYNTAEYRWVKSKVLEASGARMMAKVTEANMALMASSHEQLKKQYESAPNDDMKRMYKEMLDRFEANRSEVESQQTEPHVAYNQQLLSKYENVLNAIAVEASKYSEEGDDPTAALEKWEKDVDKLAAAPQN